MPKKYVYLEDGRLAADDGPAWACGMKHKWLPSDVTAAYDGLGTWTDTGLEFALAAGETRMFWGIMGCTTSGTGIGISLGVTGPAGYVAIRTNGEMWTSAAASNSNPGTLVDYGEVMANAVGPGGTERRVDLWGVVTAGETGGTFKIRFRVAEIETTGDVTIKAGSVITSIPSTLET